MSKHTIDFNVDDEINLLLPDGSVISVVFSCLEPGEQLPEIDILLPKTLTVNCFGEGLVPAKSSKHAHVLDSRQMIIPISIDTPE